MPAISTRKEGRGQADPLKVLRPRVYEILEIRAPGDRWARVAGLALVALIIANVVAVILQSMAPLDTAYHWSFRAFEAFSIGGGGPMR